MLVDGYIELQEIGKYDLAALDRSGNYTAQPFGGIWVRVEIGKNRVIVVSRYGVHQDLMIQIDPRKKIDRTIIIGFLLGDNIWITDMMSLIGLNLSMSPFSERWKRAVSFLEMIDNSIHCFQLAIPTHALFIPFFMQMCKSGFDGIIVKPMMGDMVVVRTDKKKNGWYFCKTRE